MGRGKPPAPAIRMSQRHHKLLKKESSRHKIAHQLKTRISILLLASQGQSHAGIKRALGVSVNTIKQWRSRWEEGYESLLEFELGKSGEGVSDKELLGRMISVLRDKPRSGTPKRITLSQEQQIVALACEKPEDYGIEMTQWNREMLAHVAKSKGIVETISPRYISEILKKKRASST